jgi:hypothetical protein
MTDKVDYLDEDPVLTSQRYCVVSVLTPKNFKLSEQKNVEVENDGIEVAVEVQENAIVTGGEHNVVLREVAALKTQLNKYKKDKELNDKNITMSTFKVRGSYETIEEAQKRIQFLNSIDSNVNIYLAEVGKWCPFDDDPEKAKDAVYKDEELNRLMKGYKENQEKGKQLFEQRKAEMVAKALQDNKEKKTKNKDVEEKSKLKIEESLNEKEKELKNKEEQVKEGKKEVEQKKSEIHSKEDKIRKLNEEVNIAKKKYEEMLAKAGVKG